MSNEAKETTNEKEEIAEEIENQKKADDYVEADSEVEAVEENQEQQDEKAEETITDEKNDDSVENTEVSQEDKKPEDTATAESSSATSASTTEADRRETTPSSDSTENITKAESVVSSANSLSEEKTPQQEINNKLVEIKRIATDKTENTDEERIKDIEKALTLITEVYPLLRSLRTSRNEADQKAANDLINTLDTLELKLQKEASSLNVKQKAQEVAHAAENFRQTLTEGKPASAPEQEPTAGATQANTGVDDSASANTATASPDEPVKKKNKKKKDTEETEAVIVVQVTEEPSGQPSNTDTASPVPTSDNENAVEKSESRQPNTDRSAKNDYLQSLENNKNIEIKEDKENNKTILTNKGEGWTISIDPNQITLSEPITEKSAEVFLKAVEAKIADGHHVSTIQRSDGKDFSQNEKDNFSKAAFSNIQNIQKDNSLSADEKEKRINFHRSVMKQMGADKTSTKDMETPSTEDISSAENAAAAGENKPETPTPSPRPGASSTNVASPELPIPSAETPVPATQPKPDEPDLIQEIAGTKIPGMSITSKDGKELDVKLLGQKVMSIKTDTLETAIGFAQSLFNKHNPSPLTNSIKMLMEEALAKSAQFAKEFITKPLKLFTFDEKGKTSDLTSNQGSMLGSIFNRLKIEAQTAKDKVQEGILGKLSQAIAPTLSAVKSITSGKLPPVDTQSIIKNIVASPAPKQIKG